MAGYLRSNYRRTTSTINIPLEVPAASNRLPGQPFISGGTLFVFRTATTFLAVDFTGSTSL